MQTLGWGFPAERAAWATVEFGGDGVEVSRVWTVSSVPSGSTTAAVRSCSCSCSCRALPDADGVAEVDRMSVATVNSR
jgi:hypothetical protein